MNLTIKTAKNATIKDLCCTPNTIVLAKQTMSTNVKTGEVTTKVQYMEVCNVKKTEKLEIVKSLLWYCVSEFKVRNEFEKNFSDTNIKQKALFNEFLSGNTIYRTDSTGRISNALVSEIPLNKTALNVRDYHTIVTCKKDNLKVAIHQHALAIIAQCQYLRLVTEKVATLEAENKGKTETKTTTEEKPKPAPIARTSNSSGIVPAPAMVAMAK